MNIDSVGRASTYQPIQRMPEASEAQAAPDNDGDSDDGGAQAIPSPTVNAIGQLVGQLINVIA